MHICASAGAQTTSEGYDSVKTGSMVKHSYNSRLEVHSSATAGARRSQAEVRLGCTVMPVGLPSSALQSKKSIALSKQDQI